MPLNSNMQKHKPTAYSRKGKKFHLIQQFTKRLARTNEAPKACGPPLLQSCARKFSILQSLCARFHPVQLTFLKSSNA